MNKILLGQIAGILVLVQIVPYVVSILRGNTKPERTSYLIWLIVEIIGAISYVSIGATTTKWTVIAFCFTALLVFLLSIKYGVGGFSAFDIGCFLLALSGVVLWGASSNALLALYFITFVKAIAYLPTIKKVYFTPHTENTASWVLTASASVLNLFALNTLAFGIVMPITIAAVLQIFVSYLIVVPRKSMKSKRSKKHTPHKFHLFLAHPVFSK
jgi:hypothetical protein